MKVSVVVAHPDDEVIWCGGLIIERPQWDWTVLSLCRSDDPDRCPKFKAVCKKLGVHGIISDLDDSPEPLPIDLDRDIGQRVLEALGKTPWDLCLTHGQNGEYGHLRHKQVHEEMVRLVKSGQLSCRELWTFAYQCDAPEGACQPASWANKRIPLSSRTLAQKRKIVQEQYGFAADSFEVRACISPESFLTIKGTIEENSHEGFSHL